MFTYHQISTPAAEFGVFSDIVMIWQSKCQDGLLPAWQDFGVADFLGWHTYLALSEAEVGRDDLRFRFFGDGATALQGSDFTGSSFAEALPIAYEKLYRSHIQRLLEEPTIATARTPAAGNDVKQYFLQVAHLPLSDDGVTVSKILHVLKRED